MRWLRGVIVVLVMQVLLLFCESRREGIALRKNEAH